MAGLRGIGLTAALAGMLAFAGAAAAEEDPLNIAIGGVRVPAMTAKLLRVNERPNPGGVMPESLQTLDVLVSALKPGSAIPDVLPVVPAGVKASRHKSSEYLADGLGEGFETMPWQGVYNDGPERREAVAGFAELLAARHEAEPDRPINVICHSHGCGISLEAFELAAPRGVRINKFITTGTRLSGLPGDNVRDRPENVGEWVNIHSRHDQAFSKSLEGKGIFNIEFTGGDSHPHMGLFSGHGMYYGNPEIRDGIRDMMNSGGSAEALVRDKYAGLFDIPPPHMRSNALPDGAQYGVATAPPQAPVEQ